MNFCYKKFLLLFFVLFFLDWVGVKALAQDDTQFPPPQFDNPTSNQTQSGQIKLEWNLSGEIQNEDSLQFELQEAQSKEFANPKTLYTGPNYASYLSGLPNGIYYYRVRIVNDAGNAASPWSEVVSATVEHYSKGLTYSLLSVGGVVFLLTIGVVVHGTIKTS